LAKTDSRISRQPAVVLTAVPSVWNSTSPLASRKARAAAGSPRCQSRAAPPWAWQALRMVLSQADRPQNSLRLALARSNDPLAPARHSSRWAAGLTNPATPSRSSSGYRPALHRGQTR
jgi:hypothetical protein